MVTVQDLSASNVFQIQPSEFQLQKFLATPSSWAITGYNIANDGIYHLWFIGRQVFELQDGTAVQNGRGFLVTKDVEGQNWQIAVESIPVSGAYGSISQNTLQEVVTNYNSIVGGQETREDVSDEAARESARQREEERQSQDTSEAVNFDEEVEAERVREREERTKLNERQIIREEVVEYNAKTSETASISRESSRFTIEQVTQGTVTNPFVTYQVTQVTPSSKDIRVRKTVDFIQKDIQTQEEAEIIFENRIEQVQAEFDARVEEEKRLQTLNAYSTKFEDEVEFYYKKSNLSFKQMLLSDDLQYSEFAFRKGVEGDTRIGGGVGVGGFGDAVSWSNGNNTLNLKDFDTPRITAEGISENQSGSVSFTVKLGWRVKFSIDTDNNIIFENKDEIDNQVVNNKIEFVMYGGDRLEIDIDNEREGVYPFLVTSAGKEWSSSVELDDDLSLTMISAEQLYFKYSEVEVQYYDNREGRPIKEKKVLNSLEGRLSYSTPPLSNNPVIASKVRTAMVESQEYQETMTYTRDIIVTDVAVESSFISPEDITPTIENPVSKYRWWIIGGVVGLIAVGALYVFINAKARGGGNA